MESCYERYRIEMRPFSVVWNSVCGCYEELTWRRHWQKKRPTEFWRENCPLGTVFVVGSIISLLGLCLLSTTNVTKKKMIIIFLVWTFVRTFVFWLQKMDTVPQLKLLCSTIGIQFWWKIQFVTDSRAGYITVESFSHW